MNLEKFERNLMDMVRENQLKLGYRQEEMRLYYPLESLQHLLEEPLSAKELAEKLRESLKEQQGWLGGVSVTHSGKRFCILLSEAAAAWVHAHGEPDPFLEALIAAVSAHGTSMEEVLEVFRRFGRVHTELVRDGEFDVLAWFEKGVPDDYRYCLTDEGAHITYHRFTPEDYQDLFGAVSGASESR